MELWGYGARTGKSKGVCDDLFAKVLVLEAGGTLVLVMLDLGGVSRGISDSIKKRLASELGVSASQIAVCTTHTHAATAAVPLRGITIDDRYIQFAEEQIVRCAIEAAADMTEAAIRYTQFAPR